MLESPIRHVPWDDLSPEEAWAYRERWDETTQARLAWLARASELGLSFARESIDEVWDWYRLWWYEPDPGPDAPELVFCVVTEPGTVETARLVGMEAVAGYLEQLALHEHPALVPAIAAKPRKGQEYHHQYAPGMDWAPRVKAGASVSTASLVQRATFLIGDDPGQSRLDGWLDDEYEAWVKSLERSRKRLFGDSRPVKVNVDPLQDPEEDVYSWEVWFEEADAAEHPDLTAEAAAVLAGVDGVTEAHHHDRNAILVAGDVTEDAIRSALNPLTSKLVADAPLR